MMRAFLQFLGVASAVVWSTLLLGTLFTPSARAEAAFGGAVNGCTDCYSCDTTSNTCDYNGDGQTACTDSFTCKCKKSERDGLSYCKGKLKKKKQVKA